MTDAAVDTTVRTGLFIGGAERFTDETLAVADPGKPGVVVGYAASASAQDVADAVAAHIEASKRPLRAVMLDRLGPTVWHNNPADAMALLEELEETARLWLLAGRSVQPLNKAQIDELRAQFNAPW